MAAKQLIFGDEARQKMLGGITQLAQAVTTTLGPKGRNVALDRSWGAPSVIHDGVTVAKEIELEDKFENMGAQLVKEAASKTNDVAGDGTTTATLLAWKLAERGMKYVTSGANPMIMKRGIDRAIKAVVAEINRVAKPVKESDWEKVATISAQSEEIGQKIAEALKKVGKDGVVEVEEGKTMEIEIEHKEGMEFDKGYASPYFVTDSENMEAVIEDTLILVTDQKLSNIKDILPLLEQVVNAGKGLVLIADEIEGEALTTLVVNKLRGSFKVLPVKAPGFGDRRKAMLQDIAVLTGASFVSEETGVQLKDVTIDLLGRADSVRSTKDSTRIVGGKGSKNDINARVAQIEAEIKNSTSDFDIEKLQERKARLTGGVAVIQVGASTEMEMKNLQERVKDAKEATKAAIESGIIPGGGVTLLQAEKALSAIKTSSEDEKVGVDLVRSVLEEPLRMLATNSGEDAGWVVGQVREKNDGSWGFNALTNKFEDLVAAGVIEPAKVAVASLENAASVASMILTTECLVTDVPKNEEAPAMGGGMPGMM
ncbi:MAG: chaperonin GroL [Candidatus Pacebacteria bacterium RIFOXYB1_FULL_39_46]|nr:MAG: chaperonin GroL [Candidatus Pacebacteria bacterium RIFOXYA1_FULL_38_18]OGJ38151.1 MAG: chaperonin GroL [Candidatus Pacebacteria bacterium RIFOXYB1_FULL_39_46]OGJ39627.1 MAG: chaperonin GroL [Candidatus Pacebacteria bacterium RIFOXYC1_FULL_39_21]OGJ39903.1 MAG: chaperonin GroL [Candidatus Pacebacteria bacterium RIFOXYD1_FULL_39_27]